MVRIGLAFVDLFLRQFVRAHRIAAGQLGRRGIVSDRVHLENVQPAEFGDLVEAESEVLSTSQEAVACGMSGWATKFLRRQNK